jgi:hypothetical protein
MGTKATVGHIQHACRSGAQVREQARDTDGHFSRGQARVAIEAAQHAEIGHE